MEHRGRRDPTWTHHPPSLQTSYHPPGVATASGSRMQAGLDPINKGAQREHLGICSHCSNSAHICQVPVRCEAPVQVLEEIFKN